MKCPRSAAVVAAPASLGVHLGLPGADPEALKSLVLDSWLVAGADVAVLQAQPQAVGGPVRGGQLRVGRRELRQVQQPRVVAEVVVEKVRPAVQPQSPPDQAVELPQEEVGQVERRRLRVVQRCERRPPGQALVAVRPGQPPDAAAFHHGVQAAPRATAPVPDENLLVRPARRRVATARRDTDRG